MTDKEKNEQDILNEYINKNQPKKEQQVDNDVEYFGDNVRRGVDYIETSLEEQFHNIDIEHLPFHKFYPFGTKIFIRAAKTKEIEAFSVVNETNKYDVHSKMVQMLKACVRIEYSNGTYGSYKDLMYGDRDILIMIIARLTSKNGRKLGNTIKCSSCGTENQVEYIPANYVFFEEDEDLIPFFNTDTRKYDFKLITGARVSIAPPTVGIIDSLNQYVLHNSIESQQNSTDGKLSYIPNISFINNIAYLKSGAGVNELDVDEWKQEEYAYERMNPDLFSFIEDTISNKMNFGVKTVKSVCKDEYCKNEITFPFHFPEGVKSLFVVPNAFNKFIQKSV